MVNIVFYLLLVYRHKKRRPRVVYSQNEAFALPIPSNKQQETYAGMKTHYIHMRCSMDIIIPVGIHCYFDFDGI